MSSHRTYSMLASLGRMPSRYELVSSHLSWRPTRGRALPLAAERWHQEHGAEARLGALPYEDFADPEGHTYRSWASSRRARETTVASLFAADEPMALEPAYRARVIALIGPLRYAGHAAMMLAGYLGSLAPSGRLTIVFALQAGDEMRRVHRLAERLHQLGEGAGELGPNARAAWERGEAWHALRTLCERALTAWDFDDAFAATQLALKPALDAYSVGTLRPLAHAHGDLAMVGLLDSLALDQAWHQRVGEAFVAFVAERSEGAAARLEEARARWAPRAFAAVEALGAVPEEESGGS